MVNDTVLDLLVEATKLVPRYYDLTGKPFGITDEVAEYEATTLGLKLTTAKIRHQPLLR